MPAKFDTKPYIMPHSIVLHAKLGHIEFWLLGKIVSHFYEQHFYK